MRVLAPSVLCVLAISAGTAVSQVPTTHRDKWMSGSCGLLGLKILSAPEKAPIEWKQLAVAFVGVPMVSDPPLKDDPSFVAGRQWAEKQLEGVVPSPEASIFARGIASCANWAEDFLKRQEPAPGVR